MIFRVTRNDNDPMRSVCVTACFDTHRFSRYFAIIAEVLGQCEVGGTLHVVSLIGSNVEGDLVVHAQSVRVHEIFLAVRQLSFSV